MLSYIEHIDETAKENEKAITYESRFLKGVTMCLLKQRLQILKHGCVYHLKTCRLRIVKTTKPVL